jgi:hypothetical protein
MKIEQIFLESIRDEVWSEKVCKPHEKLREKALFILRFNPDNVRSDYKTHQQLAKEMAKLPQFKEENLVPSIGCYVGKIIKDVFDKYETEINQSNLINQDDLFTSQKGKKGAWEKLYQWLWSEKFTQWKLDFNLWEYLKKQAQETPNWIRSIDDIKLDQIARGLFIENNDLPEETYLIPLKKPTYFFIHLPYPGQYLLLLNRGQESSYVVTPSLAFAPQPFLQETPLILPKIQEEARQPHFQFNQTGKEEFLGIVIQQPITLDWLIKPKQLAPVLNGERFLEIWQYLNQNEENYQVFYQCFDVQ